MEIKNVDLTTKSDNVEAQRLILEGIKSEDPTALGHPILERCASKQVDPNEAARQAYDRMHHRHNRS